MGKVGVQCEKDAGDGQSEMGEEACQMEWGMATLADPGSLGLE